MSEEQQEGGMSTIKKTVLGVVTTAITGAGVYITTHINQIFGIEDEEEKTEQVAQPAAQPAPIVLNIDNSSQNNSSNSGGGGTTIIKETVREVPAQPVAAPVEEKEETPIERMKRLKAEKAKQDGGQE